MKKALLLSFFPEGELRDVYTALVCPSATGVAKHLSACSERQPASQRYCPLAARQQLHLKMRPVEQPKRTLR
jgi:hypothetical protein